MHDFDLVGNEVDLEERGMVSEAVATASLDSDSIFVECGNIRRFAILLVCKSYLCSQSEKNARWRKYWIVVLACCVSNVQIV